MQNDGLFLLRYEYKKAGKCKKYNFSKKCIKAKTKEIFLRQNASIRYPKIGMLRIDGKITRVLQ